MAKTLEELFNEFNKEENIQKVLNKIKQEEEEKNEKRGGDYDDYTFSK